MVSSSRVAYGGGAAEEGLLLATKFWEYEDAVLIPGRWLLRRLRKIAKSDY
jgi:short-subunit dehydrogenase involved in D-alanine esterification of teichoic acids